MLVGQNTIPFKKGHKAPAANINDIAWLSGYWVGEAFGGYVDEIWSEPKGGNMMASFRLIVNGKISFSEIESISEENGTLVMRIKHFDALLHSWEKKDEVETFPLVKIAKNTAWFDGLTIKKTSKKTLSIFVVSENEKGIKEELAFHFKRKKLK